MEILDREMSDRYILVVEANTCDPSETDCEMCETRQTRSEKVSQKMNQNDKGKNLYMFSS